MRSVNYLLSIIFTAVFLCLVSGCSNAAGQDGPRYVITSPELAELVAILAGPDPIAGVTIECDYPPFLKELPKIGNFGAVDMEKIVNLSPTLVFTSGLEQQHITNELAKLNIPVAPFYPQSISQLDATIAALGLLLQKEATADSLRRFLQEQLACYSAAIPEYRPRVFVEIYGSPLMSVSDSSFVGELISLAGGRNVFPDLPREYSRISAEKVVDLDPEIIIVTYPGVDARTVASRKGWEVISACRNGRIYTTEDINPDLILRATPRALEGIKRLRELFHAPA
ncbi:MAG: ABC transporter substrate-binding protein [Candidatus Cloacimonetes bacterium]|nr:ABC transporter substrate-binding protein [Candidatus Cloacimonadota bacterium]